MITALAKEHCELGENPLWDSHDETLYWTDVLQGRLHRYDSIHQRFEVIYEGEKVGGFTLQIDGSLLLFRVEDIAVLCRDGRVDVLQSFYDSGSERFNDVIADPEGRVFAGTIGKTPTSGGLFRLDPDGSMTLFFRGSGVANGIGFSSDLRTFYWTCSTRKTFSPSTTTGPPAPWQTSVYGMPPLRRKEFPTAWPWTKQDMCGLPAGMAPLWLTMPRTEL